MTAIKKFSSQHPLPFMLLIVLGWYGLALLIRVLTGPMRGSPTHRLVPGLIELLAFLVYLLLAVILFWRVGWLRPSGIFSLGHWQVWVAALCILIYMLPAELYAFFGNAAFKTPFPTITYFFRFYLRTILDSPSDKSTIFFMFVISCFNESFYRGIVLYAFILAWGRTKLGILASVIVSALIFGILSIYTLIYTPLTEAELAGRLVAVLSGIWLGVLVRRWGSIWPGVFLYTLMSLIPIIPTDFLHFLRLPDPRTALVRLAVFELPLVLLGIWFLLRMPSRPKLVETPPTPSF